MVAGALLDVGGLLEPREHREDAACAVELAALDVDLDGRLEQAQHDPAGVDLLGCELVARCLRVVPATQHAQRVSPLG